MGCRRATLRSRRSGLLWSEARGGGALGWETAFAAGVLSCLARVCLHFYSSILRLSCASSCRCSMSSAQNERKSHENLDIVWAAASGGVISRWFALCRGGRSEERRVGKEC